MITNDQDRIVNRYHQGQHTDCITCRHIKVSEAQAEQLRVLEAAADTLTPMLAQATAIWRAEIASLVGPSPEPALGEVLTWLLDDRRDWIRAAGKLEQALSATIDRVQHLEDALHEIRPRVAELAGYDDVYPSPQVLAQRALTAIDAAREKERES